MARRIGGQAPAQKVGQRLGLAHAGRRLAVDQGAAAPRDEVTVQHVGVCTVMPAGRAARLHNEADVGTGVGVDHLLHVAGCHGVLTLQVRAAEIHKNGPVLFGRRDCAQAYAQCKHDQNRNEFFQTLVLLVIVFNRMNYTFSEGSFQEPASEKRAAFLLEIQNDDDVAVSVGEAILGEMLFIV